MTHHVQVGRKSSLSTGFLPSKSCGWAQVGQSISKESLTKQAPKRPAEGWSIVVRPAGRGVEFEPFVARPDGSRRPLTSDEELYIDRMKPLPRRRFI